MRDKYTTQNIRVSSEQLLFDPLNYRLWSNRSQVEQFKATRLDEPTVQEEVYLELTRKDKANSHGIDELAKSINENGFVQLATIFVVKYRSKYLVVEGNRRLAAISKLLKTKSLSQQADNTISKLAVTEIICHSGIDERAVINHIISIHQFAGPKQWGPMQQAYYVYDTYMNHYKRTFASDRFIYNYDVAKKAAEELHLAVPQAKKLIKVSSAYQNLMERGYPVEVFHYSIIVETVSRDKFAQEYFEFDKEKYVFSEAGAERFYSMCLDDEDRPVNDPKKIAWIYKMHLRGDHKLLEKVINRAVSLEEANETMKRKEEKHKFSDSLKRATKILEELGPSDFGGYRYEVLDLEKHLRITEQIKQMAINTGAFKG